MERGILGSPAYTVDRHPELLKVFFNTRTDLDPTQWCIFLHFSTNLRSHLLVCSGCGCIVHILAKYGHTSSALQICCSHS